MKAVAKQFNCDQVRQLARLTGPTGNYSEAEFGCKTLSDPLLMWVSERLSPLGRRRFFQQACEKAGGKSFEEASLACAPQRDRSS